ncbi:BrnT family toxin [Bordetella trematum]|uniref:BrnT family toxin n=1 Tax=Bordetella trematum TaxID=123899 RepID=UPI003988C36B
MDIAYDPAKNDKNIAERGLSFELAHGFEWNSALVIEDARQDYSEVRYQALGKIEERLYMLVFTVRDEAIRVISLRKANSREVARYEKAQS